MAEANLAESVFAKLKAEAARRKISSEPLDKYWVVEAFLRRLACSEFGDAVTLKGGTLFRLWNRETARYTKDLDLDIRAEDASRAREIVAGICRTDLSHLDGVVFRAPDEYEETKGSTGIPGLQALVSAAFGKPKPDLKLDIGCESAPNFDPHRIRLNYLQRNDNADYPWGHHRRRRDPTLKT